MTTSDGKWRVEVLKDQTGKGEHVYQVIAPDGKSFWCFNKEQANHIATTMNCVERVKGVVSRTIKRFEDDEDLRGWGKALAELEALLDELEGLG